MALGHKFKFDWRHRFVISSAFLLALFLLSVTVNSVSAAFGDCGPGFVFDPRSGVGCKQADCPKISGAHYSYEGYCVCGTSGSVNENPSDPNKECSYPSEYKACPGCVYACVHFEEDCPDAGGATTAPAPAVNAPPVGETTAEAGGSAATEEQPAVAENIPAQNEEKKEEPVKPAATSSIAEEASRIADIANQMFDDSAGGPVITRAGIGEGLANAVKRGFSVMMEMIGWGTEKAFGIAIQENKNDANAGWSGRFVTEDGDYVDVKVFEGKLSLNWTDGVAAEFNLISIKGRPGSGMFVDGFSIGIGPGSAGKDEASPSVPGLPVSPNINVENIRNWFDEKWRDTKSWWQENVPWPLGSANAPNIGGSN